ncbi:hypothetical protein HDU92_006140 [Lobulomyces angularis]|nr:hypothetical protein HDU92_006140 [Lobulomyces angularis]
MSTNPKKPVLEKDIDSSRLKGNWQLSKLLSAKYTLKYVPNSSLECICLAEYSFNNSLNLKSFQQFDSITPENFFETYLQYLKEPLVFENSIDPLNKLELAIKNGEGIPGILFQCNILSSLINLHLGNFKESLNLLSKFEFNTEKSLSECGQYGKVLSLMGSYTKCLAQLFQNQLEEAWNTINISAISLQTQQQPVISPIQSKLQYQAQNPEQNQWIIWVEKILFIHILLGYRFNKEESEFSKSIKLYLELANTEVPTTLKTNKFVSILTTYFKSLSSSLSFSLLSGIPKYPMASQFLSMDAVDTLVSLLPFYEKLVTSILPFPRGEDMTALDEQRFERVLNCYNLWTIALSHSPSGESPVNAVERHYKLIEACYRGTKHTFLSLQVLRHLSHTFASLIKIFGDNMCEQEKIEAENIVASYVFLWEKQFLEEFELTQKHKIEAKFLEQKRRRSSLDASKLPPISDSDIEVLTEDTNAEIFQVGKELVFDAIGVYLTGARILVMNVEGDERKLNLARKYSTKAASLYKDHIEGNNKLGDLLSDSNFIKSKVHQYSALTYGELAMEVHDSDIRRSHQINAIDSFKKAIDVNLIEDGQVLLFQYALQYAELGEIDTAIEAVRLSLKKNSYHVGSYNLLALCLAYKGDFKTAQKICDGGFKECVAALTKNAKEASVKADGEEPGRPFSWDQVDSRKKEELINLKLTEVAIELKLTDDVSAVLESFFSCVKHFRRFFGNLVTERSAKPNTIGLDDGGRRSLRIPTFPVSPSMAVLPSIYRFRVFDLQICLWLMASSLYRGLLRFEEANEAIEEANKVLDSLIRTDESLRNSPSRIFQTGAINIKKINVKGSREGLRKASTSCGEAKFGVIDLAIRRIMADIAFETCLVRQAKFEAESIITKKINLPKYLSPVAKADFEYKALKQKNFLENGKDGSSSGGGGYGFYKRGNISNISVATSNNASNLFVNRIPSQQQHRGSLLIQQSAEYDSVVTMESLVDDYLSIIEMDGEHIPTLVHLGKLYFYLKDFSLSEYWLERAMKRGKARGAGGGKSGITTYYGGYTGIWYYEGWKSLGEIMKVTNRLEQEKNVSNYIKKLKKFNFFRGLECLNRFEVSGKEW